MLTAVDLFSGAGGLSLGLKRAGFRTLLAIDSWRPAVDTYNHNFGGGAIEEKLNWESTLPKADLFVGGPPCQGFSSAGRKAPGDKRNTLVAVFAHLVAKNRPRAFIFENVEGFLTGDGGRWVIDLLAPLVEAGYCISVRKVNAANYGVPQHRKRVVVVGGLGWLPGLPAPTHLAVGAPGATRVAQDKPLAPSVMQALEGLPPAVERGNPPLVDDHEYRPPRAQDIERMSHLRPGQTMRDLPPTLWHNTYARRANRRVADGTPTEKRGGAPAGMRRLHPDEPSKSITSGATSELVHPLENRMLTIRESARLQTFPDTFVFKGNASDRKLQIGNAVPPLLAEQFALHVAYGLREPNKDALEPGIYEFTPTESTGLSPALARTIDLVSTCLPMHSVEASALQPALFGD